jgi:hypothetical protein
VIRRPVGLGIVGFGTVTTLVTTGVSGGAVVTKCADAVAGCKALPSPTAPRTIENDMPKAVAVGKYRRRIRTFCPLVVRKPVNPD